MPAGCDFVCRNDDCDQYQKSFTMTGLWPMGNIDDVLASKRVADNESLKNMLEEFKKQGRKAACINFPNDDEVETTSYRVHLWCDDCRCIWMFDTDDLESAENGEFIVPDNCDKCNGELRNFQDTTTNHIDCPYCGDEMKQQRWFCNEKEDDDNKEDEEDEEAAIL